MERELKGREEKKSRPILAVENVRKVWLTHHTDQANKDKVQDILEQLGNSGQLEPLLQADECQYGVTKSEEDSSWGRVKIRKNEGGSTEVLFLDFGSVEVKRLDEIFMMPEIVREIPAAAFWVSIASREEDTEENRMSIYDLLDVPSHWEEELKAANYWVK